MVGYWLPRRMGLGGDLLLRHRRQRNCRAGAPAHTLRPAGNPLWSGGTDGPEGSLLVIPIVLLILAWLLIVYRRPRPAAIVSAAGQEQLAS